MQSSDRKVGVVTATSMVIANMIGTGIFTSLGFQLVHFDSPFVLISLWLVGGVLALCGSFSYAELACRLPGSGGEYQFITQIYGKAAGFLAGWVSLVAAFTAPVAAASFICAKLFLAGLAPNLAVTPQVSHALCLLIALAIIMSLSWLNEKNVNILASFQNIFVFLKMILIVAFIGAGFYFGRSQAISYAPKASDLSDFFRPEYAVSLVFVGYAFSGWNAATYIASEIKDLKKNLPRALIMGTLIVTVFYVLLNLVFLYSTPMGAMRMKEEVASVVAQNIFGLRGGQIISLLVGLCLISTISSMIWAGSRVAHTMGRNHRALKILAQENSEGRPIRALRLQAMVSILILCSMSFEKIILYMGFILSLCTFFCVFGLFILRYQKNSLKPAYSATGFPWSALIFLIMTGGIIGYLSFNQPASVAISIGTLGVGYLLYYVFERKKPLASYRSPTMAYLRQCMKNAKTIVLFVWRS